MCAECPYIVFISKEKQTTSALKVRCVVLGKTGEIPFEQTKWTDSLCFRDWTNWIKQTDLTVIGRVPPMTCQNKGLFGGNTKRWKRSKLSTHTDRYFLGGTHSRCLKYVLRLVRFTAVQCPASCQQYMLHHHTGVELMVISTSHNSASNDPNYHFKGQHHFTWFNFVYVWRTPSNFLASNSVRWTFFFPLRTACLWNKKSSVRIITSFML